MSEFERIYREYFNDVYRYLCGLTGDEALAEEITSETFFKAMRALDGFRGECEIRVWLCQIAKHCYFSYRKKQKRADGEDLPETAALPGASMEEQCVAHEDADRARAVLHGLPEPYREVFFWRVFAELSFRQIGQLFGKSENWACVTYHRARAKIKLKLEDKIDGT